MLSEKQEQRQIRRLKEILFPKNKRTVNQPKTNQVNPNVFEQKTKRQLISNKTNIQRSKSRTVKNPLQQQNVINISNDPLNKNQYLTQNYKIEQQPQNHLIKHQIDKLKLQINNMLNKWNDQPQNQKKQSSNLKTYQTSQNLALFQSHHQQLTRQHYLKNINQISKNLQKYNAYMYGIKQASQSMIQNIPLFQENYLLKIEDIRAYKLFYLGKLLLSYFIQKIQIIKKYQLRSAFKNIMLFSQDMQTQRKKQKQRKAINKGNNLFLRKNLLDKAFKRWRINSALIKFKQTINEQINCQISISNNNRQKSLSINQGQSYTCHEELKDVQFLCKNILQKQKVVQFLNNYLMGITQKLSKVQTGNQNNNIKNKEYPFYLDQEIQILFIDSNNKQAFSYINSNSLFNENQSNQVSQSRIDNVLNSITDHNALLYQQNQKRQNQYKKYSFQLKNSLTRMCIDSSKIIRIPQIKQNQVYSLQVDGSIAQQIWIKTSKTQRGQNKSSFISTQNIPHLKNPIINEEVFYEQQSLIQQQAYKFQCPSIKTSVIFYPLIHQNNFIGLVRHYIYHSSQISLPQLEIPFENLQFVSESIFTTFELSYSFESLRKERRLIDQGYTLKVIRMVKKVEAQARKILKLVQNEGINQNKISQRLMGVFQVQMQRILSIKRYNNEKDSVKDNNHMSWNMRVHKVVYKNEINNVQNVNLKRDQKLLVCVDDNLEQVQFRSIFGQGKGRQDEQINRYLVNVLSEFYQKQSQIEILSDVRNNKFKMKVILIKSSSEDGLYFSFTYSLDKKDIICDKKDILCNQNKQQILPPLQLLIDIVNKFVYTLHSTVDRSRQIESRLKQRSMKQKQIKKTEIKQNMRLYYLDSIKMCAFKSNNKLNNIDRINIDGQSNNIDRINIDSKLTNIDSKSTNIDSKQVDQSYIMSVNRFISESVNRLFKQLRNHNNELQKTIICRVQYIVRTKVPYYNNQISQTMSIKVVLSFTNKEDNLLSQQVVNETEKNILQQNIDYQISIFKESQQIYQYNNNQLQPTQNLINFQLNSLHVETSTYQINNQNNNKMNNKNSNQLQQNSLLNAHQIQSILNTHQIQSILKDIITHYIQLTQQIQLNQLIKNQINNQENDLTQKQQQINKQNNLQQSLSEFIPQIKQKLFQIHLNNLNINQQIINNHENSQLINNHQLSFLNLVNSLIKSYLTSHLNLSKQNHVNIISHPQNISKILDQSETNKKNILESIQKKIKCQYYQFLPNQSLQILQKTIGYLYTSTQNKQNRNKQCMLQTVIKKLRYFDQYRKRLNRNSDSNIELKDQDSFNDLIRSSYLIVSSVNKDGINKLPLLTIKINNSHLNTQNLTYIQSIQHNVSTLIQFMLKEYRSINKWQYGINKLNNIMSGFNTLTNYSKSNKQIMFSSNQTDISKYQEQITQNIICQKQSLKPNTLFPKSLIYSHLSYAFNNLKSYSNHLTYKAKYLLSLSFLTSKSNKNILIKSLKKWQINTSHISNQQLTSIIKQKIVYNIQKSQQKINVFIQKISSICYNNKMLWAFKKISFYARHQRIVDFNVYRLKFLDAVIQKLRQKQNRNDRMEMKRFFSVGFDIVFEKRRDQIVKQKRMKLFDLKLQNSMIFKKYVRQSLREGLKKIKFIQTLNKQQLQIDTNIQLVHRSLDEQVSQSESLQQLSDILQREFGQFDIWVKPNKNIDQFIIISISTKQHKRDTLNYNTKKNLSFDESSLVSTRLNDNLFQIKSNSHKLSKDDVYSLYSNDEYPHLETPNAIFISRDANKQSSLSLISSQTNLASIVVNLSSNSTQLSFKQKQKLNSLSKCLSQFLTHYKIQLNTKILHLQSLYQTLKTKRYTYAFKRWKKQDQNLLLLKTYQLTDHVYQLNIETDNIEQKIKQQDKEINQNQTQYNKLVKKQQQQKSKIQKYQNNIQVLNKMLQYYHQIQKKQDDFLKSASKSSSRKTSKISYHYQGPAVNLSTLTNQEMNTVLLSLTRWRQINANQKLKQLKINNFTKQIKILNRCLIESQKTINKHFKVTGFHHILSHSLKIKQLILKKEQQQKNKFIQLEKQKQKILKQNAQKLKLQKEKIQIEKMQQLFRNSPFKTINDLKDDQNKTWKSQKFAPTQKSFTNGQKTTHQNSKIQVSRDVSQNQIKLLPQNTYFSSKNHLTRQYEFFTPNQTEPRSLADQLQQSFSELNRRLVTFQKNLMSPSQQNDEYVEPQVYFNKYEISQIERQPDVQHRKQSSKPLQQSNVPNNTVQIIPQMQKMTEQEKIKFELERMRMKKLQFNKENLTVTQEQYDRLNGGNGYKLGGKTLRFLKRMGKLQTTDREKK